MKLNILYIHSHDTGRYIQPYGHAVPTPRLQALAESGVLFRQNFCINPTCSASRASLLTGTYPHSNGMIGLAHRGFSMNDYGKHIVNTLRPAGYSSILAGVQHVAANRADMEAWQVIGYDRFLGNAPTAHEAAVSFLSDSPAEPFFLSVGFSETHRRFPDTEDCEDDPRYCLPPAPLPDTPETRQDMTRFKASARILDAKIGAVLDALETGGLADRTLVICTTDHGIAFPRMKCNLHDSGTGVLLIMRGPRGAAAGKAGAFTGGKVVDAMTTHLDIFPTICDLTGIARPDWLQGESLLPLVSGKTESIHDEIFGEVNYHAAYEPMRSVRTGRWKYIRRFEERARPVLPNCDQGESKTLWMDCGWNDMRPPLEMLYDLVFDPNESCNLAGAAGDTGVLDDMRGRLDRWMRRTDDPLLRGPIAAPGGARINDPDGVSPEEPLKTVE